MIADQKWLMFALSWIVSFLLPLMSSHAETLNSVLIAAYLKNPSLLAERAWVRAIDEGLPEALAGYKPRIEILGTFGRQHIDSTGTGVQDLNPISGQVSVSQPLYQGGRTAASVREAVSLSKSGRAQLTQVEQDVLLTAVVNYLNVRRDISLVELNGNNVWTLQTQLEAVRERFNVGELTRANVAQAEARLARASSDKVQAESALSSSRASFKTVTGIWPIDLRPVSLIHDLPLKEDHAIAVAINSNPKLLAAIYSEEASRHNIRSRKGNLLPTLTIVGDLTHSEDVITKGITSDSAQIVAQLVVPLYQGGQANADIRRAIQINQLRRLDIETIRRKVVEDVSTNWYQVTAAKARIQSGIEDIQASEIILEGIRIDVQMGNRNNLDVLDAEQELLNARVALIVAKRDQYVAAFRLRAAMGKMTARELGLDVEYYLP